jgi:hypothetical protein
MQTYMLRRRGVAAGARELAAALTRLREFEETPSALQARWLHSYAVREDDGRFGLACLFEAASARTLRRHAELTRLPAEEILPVTTTLTVRRFAPTMVYLIRRRSFWSTAADLDRSAELSHRVGDEEMAREVSWLRSYAVREDDGTLGAMCLYQGVDPQALRVHAARVGMPADEITPVIGRIVFREERQPAAAGAALI